MIPTPFEPGQSALLVDAKGRRYLVKIQPGQTFQYHRGVVPHEDIAAAGDGGLVTASGGGRLRVLRPRMADFVLKMQRRAQVVYPKDIGPILVWADIGPGMTVLEAGTGSAALTTALARAVGASGRVVSVERREEHQKVGRKTLQRWFGEVPAHVELRSGDVEDVIGTVDADRIVLDLPEPWHAAGRAAETSAPGTILCAYLPTVPQIQTLVETLRSGPWAEIEVMETLYRTWNVSGRSVRPSHQMVGHTGFLVIARRVEPDETQEGGSERPTDEGQISDPDGTIPP